MERLDVLLLHRLPRHKTHVGLPGGCADRFGIVAIVLLAEHEGLHVLQADDLDRMTKALELALPVERSRAGLEG